MGIVIGGRGVGKTAMHEIIIKSVNDGDLQTKINGVAYSTSAREVLTVNDMVNYSIKRGDFENE